MSGRGLADGVAALRQGFFGDVLVLFSWTVLSQLLSIVAMVILPRLFGAAPFGTFAVFSGFAVMIGIVVSLRYEFAIGLPERHGEAAALFTLCVGLAVVLGGTTAVLGAALVTGSMLDLRFPELHAWWVAVGIGGAAIGAYNATCYLALRHREYGLLGRSKAAIALVTGGAQIGAALLFGATDAALILPFIGGQLVGAALIVRGMAGRERWSFDAGMLLEQARRYRRFPKYVASGSLLDGLSNLLPVAGIAYLHGAAAAGLYAVADRSLRMPVTLVGTSVLQAFYQRAAEQRGRPRETMVLMRRTWLQLLALALGPALLVVAFGPTLFGWVFGAEFTESGRVARILALPIVLFLLSYATANILVVREHTRAYLVLQAVQAAAFLSAFAVAAQVADGGLLRTVAIFAVAQCLTATVSLLLQLRSASAD